MHAVWKTAFTQAFGCSLPIMGAPMAGVSGGLLAAETCRAGALGFVAAGHATDLEQLDREVALFRDEAPGSQLGLGFITHSACKDGDLSTLEHVLQRHNPEVVQFFAPAVITSQTSKTTNIEVAQSYDAKVIVQVGSIKEAKRAIEAGVDGIIAQGSEAGGHGRRRDLGNGTFGLAARIASLSGDIPTLAAGGMVNGRSLAAALALGCDGIVLGTRLWASQEGLGQSEHKEMLTKAECDDCLRTTVMDQVYNSYASTPWPYPYDSVGVLRNKLTDEWDGRPRGELEAAMEQVAPAVRQAIQEGNTDLAQVYAGEGVGDIASVEGAFDIIRGVSTEGIEIVTAMPTFVTAS